MANVQKRRRKWQCLFCLKDIDDDLSNRECTESMFNSCFRHLSTNLLSKPKSFKMFQNNHGSFCDICFQAAQQLSQKNELLTTVEKEVKDFVTCLADSILQNRNSSVNTPFEYQSEITIIVYKEKKISRTKLTKVTEPDRPVDKESYDCYEEEVQHVEIEEIPSNTTSGDNIDDKSLPENTDADDALIPINNPIMTKIVTKKNSNGKLVILSIPCECGTSFEDIEVFKEHKFSCSVNNISKNINEEEAEVRFRCGVCGYLAKNIEELGKHKLRHSKSYSCTKCDEKFRKKMTLLSHIESVHPPKKRKIKNADQNKKNDERQCDQCGMIFKSKTHLNYHVISKHTEEMPYKCEICDRRFKFRRFLNTHMQTHMKVKDYFCAEVGCGKSFPSLLHLKKHTKLEHSDDNFKCEHCSYRTLTDKLLDRHTSHFHDPSKKFACKICGIRVTSSNRLQMHEKIHTGEKPFNCTICGEDFRTSSYLAMHKNQMHTKGKFNCPHCDYKAGRQHVLDSHLLVHSDERLFSCPQCDKKFKTLDNVNRHQKVACKMKLKIEVK